MLYDFDNDSEVMEHSEIVLSKLSKFVLNNILLFRVKAFGLLNRVYYCEGYNFYLISIILVSFLLGVKISYAL